MAGVKAARVRHRQRGAGLQKVSIIMLVFSFGMQGAYYLGKMVFRNKKLS